LHMVLFAKCERVSPENDVMQMTTSSLQESRINTLFTGKLEVYLDVYAACVLSKTSD
jgi:hypothetical protein